MLEAPNFEYLANKRPSSSTADLSAFLTLPMHSAMVNFQKEKTPEKPGVFSSLTGNTGHSEALLAATAIRPWQPSCDA